MKVTLFAAAALVAVGVSTTANAAAIGGVVKDLAVSAPAVEVETVHFRHRSCQLGRWGWHAHGQWGKRIACRPFRMWRR